LKSLSRVKSEKDWCLSEKVDESKLLSGRIIEKASTYATVE
jgi:hypothetical protein